MKTKIRNSIFEVNSSSSHVISLSKNPIGIIDNTLIPNDEGVIVLNGGVFDWQWKRFNDALTKANYCAVDFRDDYMRNVLTNVIKSRTGALDVDYKINRSSLSDDWSYIDHQSQNKVPKDKRKIDQFIFNTDSYLFLGNDNDSISPEFYYRPGTRVKYKITCVEFPNLVNRLEELNSSDLLDVLYSWNLRAVKLPDGQILTKANGLHHPNIDEQSSKEYRDSPFNIHSPEYMQYSYLDVTWPEDLKYKIGVNEIIIKGYNYDSSEDEDGPVFHYLIEEIDEVI